MLSILLLAALSRLPTAWGATSSIVDCAKVGEKNMKTIKAMIFDVDRDIKELADKDELTEEEGNTLIGNDQDYTSIFADKLSCLDSPAALKFGYPGFEKKGVDKGECLAAVGTPKTEKVNMSPSVLLGMTWDTSVCGKRVWFHGIQKKMAGPDTAADDVRGIGIYEFDDEGKVVAMSTFADTLTLTKVFKLDAKLEAEDEAAFAKDFEKKWASGEALGLESIVHGGRRSDVAMGAAAGAAAGLLMGVMGMALAGRLRRASAPPGGYQAA